MNKYKVKDEDLLVFEDDNYIIIKKHGEVDGTLFAGFDLVDIGIIGIEKNQSWNIFKNKKEFYKIINNQIKQLKKLKGKHNE
jgi:hypothetical protein